jgi:hypothetical protein
MIAAAARVARPWLSTSFLGSLASGAIVFATTVACRKDPPRRSPTLKASVSAASSVRPAASSAVPTTPAWTPQPETGPNAPAYRAVRAWNDALDRHDLAKLEKLYDDQVLFYGFRRSKAEVIAAKKADFEKRPKFSHEIIGNIEVQRVFDGLVIASFHKKSGPPDDFEVIEARLALTGAEFLVSEEQDARSIEQQNAIPEDCYKKASEVVNTIPAVARAGEEGSRELAESKGSKRLGGFGPEPDGAGGFQVVEGLYIEDFMHTSIAYQVDRSGRLTVQVHGLEKQPSKAGLEAVERACRH